MSCPTPDILWVSGCIHNNLHVLTGLILFLVGTTSSACVIRASSCFAHIRTWSLVISSVLFMTLDLTIYFSFHVLIVNATKNCSFTHLFSSRYLHSFATILNILIHSSTFSLLLPFQFTKLEGSDCLIIFFCALPVRELACLIYFSHISTL